MLTTGIEYEDRLHCNLGLSEMRLVVSHMQLYQTIFAAKDSGQQWVMLYLADNLLF